MQRLRYLLILVLLVSCPALANPSPFGLTIGATTVKDAAEQYAMQSAGDSAYSSGPMYQISADQVAFEGLQDLTLIFGADDVLLGVTATLHKDRFDTVLSGLKERYALVSSEVPFVGNKSARLQEADTVILLEARHLSFQMSLSYIDRQFLRRVQSQSNEAQQRRHQQEMDQL